MWRRVELENFRSIKHAKVDLAPFTLLVGPNGSGKSNFVDALAFARDFGRDALQAFSSRGGLASVRRWSKGAPLEMVIESSAAKSRSDLDGNGWEHRFRVVSESSRWVVGSETISIPHQPVRFSWERNDLVVTRKIGQPVGTLTAESPNASFLAAVRQTMGPAPFLPLTSIRRFLFNPGAMAKPAPIDNAELTDDGSNIAAAVHQLLGDEGAATRIKRALSKIVPGFRDILVDHVGGFGVLRIEQVQQGGDRASFHAGQLSDGTLRALATIVAAEQMIADQLLIIEEPETALHPGASNVLFAVLKAASEKGGVLITTHSPDLLDVAQDEEILVCEYRDGVTNIGPLSEAQRALVRDGLFSVSELMRSSPLLIEGRPTATLDPREDGP